MLCSIMMFVILLLEIAVKGFYPSRAPVCPNKTNTMAADAQEAVKMPSYW